MRDARQNELAVKTAAVGEVQVQKVDITVSDRVPEFCQSVGENE